MHISRFEKTLLNYCHRLHRHHCLILMSKMTRFNEHNKNFVEGLRNCRYLLDKLDRSIQKTNKYESRLLQCKASHVQECHDRGQLGAKESISSETEKPTASWRSPIDLAESWSTMSIVCLQYQYEELSKRYESLLRAYDERCAALSARDASVRRLQHCVKTAQEQLASTHEAVLSIGERYLSLRSKKLTQKSRYEAKVQRLRHKLRQMLSEVERGRSDLDEQLAEALSSEHDAAILLLLAEMKKCNLLFLQNMRLKVNIEETAT